MTIKIDNGIVKFELVNDTNTAAENSKQTTTAPNSNVDKGPGGDKNIRPRPLELQGTTYRVSTDNTQASEPLLSVTVNHDYNDQDRRPCEVLIHSHKAEHYAWTTAVARLSSALLQQGGELHHIARTLKTIFDPKGGFIDSDNRQHVSLLAAIGALLEQHLTSD